MAEINLATKLRNNANNLRERAMPKAAEACEQALERIEELERGATEDYFTLSELRRALQQIADLVDSEIGEPLDKAISIAETALKKYPLPPLKQIQE